MRDIKKGIEKANIVVTSGILVMAAIAMVFFVASVPSVSATVMPATQTITKAKGINLSSITTILPSG